MTERKAFKRRVRAQMAQTGQGYAQAAAQLEAGNPAGRPDTHPASAVVVALLSASGLRLDPLLAFGAGGGIGFMHALFRYREARHPLLTLVCQHHPEPWAPAILRRLGVEHVSLSGRRELTRLMDAERATIVPIARGSVPWLISDAVTEREERIVLALPAGDGVRIFDGTGAHARIAANELLDAYAAARGGHPLLALTEGARLPADPTPAVARGLAASVAGMTEPVLGNAFDVNFGLSGLRRWADRVADPGRDGWRRVFGDSDAWRGRLAECIDREHTAPTAGRPLFAGLLRRCGHTDAAASFDRSAKTWRSIVDGSARGSLTLEELAGHVTAIAHEEERGVALLKAALAAS